MQIESVETIKQNIIGKILVCLSLISLIFGVTLYLFVLSSTAENRRYYTPVETVKASVQTVEETYTAVGTVKPKSETMIESQVNAQVQKVHVKSGDRVNKGELLITLDDRQASSRRDGASAALNAARAGREQAMQGVNAAEAAYKEAALQYNRIRGYYKQQAATKQELEMAESNYVQTKAALKRAKDSLSASESGIKQAMGVLSETHVGLEFSKITAPSAGEVIKRMVEPGDLAMPGKPLIALRTESGFRVEAHVREGLIGRVKIGMNLKAEITTLGVTCDAEVEEIIPYADPLTRTFLVKASIPNDIEGIYPGMYGKLLIPESTQDVVLLPAKAVITTGQLELVMVQTDAAQDKNGADESKADNSNNGSGWQLRYIKTGRHSGDMVEVLSGLKGDETVGIGGLN